MMTEIENTKQPLTSMDVKWKSLYVPFLPKDLMIDGEHLFDENSMRKFFDNEMIGKVSRVDYVNKEGKVSAFIHFEHFYETASNFVEKLTREEEFRFNGYHLESNPCKYFPIVSCNNSQINRFMSVRINKTPIPTVNLPEVNVHQLVSSNKFMENLIELQKQRIAELETQLSKYINVKKEEIQESKESIENNMFMRESTIMY
jgi:hypothetical protein